MSFTNKDLTLINKAILTVKLLCFNGPNNPKTIEQLKHMRSVQKKISKMRKQNNEKPKRKQCLKIGK